jgi:hypothetical protein
MGTLCQHSVVAMMIKASNVTKMKARSAVRIPALPSLLDALSEQCAGHNTLQGRICKLIIMDQSRFSSGS